MERKIGEIFEYNGEWYQCLRQHTGCFECDFKSKSCDNIRNLRGECISYYRRDRKDVHFKKLKKVGEPYMDDEKIVQKYKIYHDPLIAKNGVVERYVPGLIDIAIKQNQEEMKDKKLNLKPFDLEAAKAGKPVCTRDGHKARIICFDLKNEGYPIVAAIGDDSSEILLTYTINGEIVKGACKSQKDLMMLPEKKEGWINVYKERIYDTKEEAIEATYDGVTYVDTIKISWEE